MFGKLKEKLKGWIKKTEEELVEPEKVEEKETSKKKSSSKKKKTSEKDKKTSKKDKGPSKIKDTEKESHEEIVEEVKGEGEAEAEEIIEEVKEKKGFFSRFRKKEKASDERGEVEEETKGIAEEKPKKKSFFRKELTKERFDDLFEELEMILLQNNVAYVAVDSIKEKLKKKLIGKSLKDVDLGKELKEAIESLLIDPPNFLEEIKKGLKEKTPYIILFCGINGSGKTTSIAKVCDYLKKNGLSVCLAAADTFRAASIEQIGQHAERLGVSLIKKDYGSDPASVGFDAVNHAKKNSLDVVLIDTAGRMQNKDSLMREMEKIVRVNSPDMKIFLGESITGNDATEQAKAFNEAIDLTGIILSKADVDEKGGTAISVSYLTGKPIFFLGTGQEYKDLEIFDKSKLIEKLGL